MQKQLHFLTKLASQYIIFIMEILQNKNNLLANHVRKDARVSSIMSVVQSFIQMWIKSESALHKEMARLQSADTEGQSKMNPFTDYGIFYGVSSRLVGNKHLTMGELSTALSVPFSRATRIVDAMVTDGYVKRVHDPDDRRIVRVTLTPEGIKLHHTIEIFTTEHVQNILSVLGKEEQEALLKLMGKILPALEKST
jgi:DNA-binding MarR family transcriptional regulator